MILTTQVDGKKEIIDGFDRISYREIDAKEPHTTTGDSTLELVSEKVTDKDFVFEIYLYRDTTFFKQIYATRPIYLMNDKGETIQRI